MRVDEQLRQAAGATRRLGIALYGGDDRTLHDEVPGVGESTGIAEACFLGKLPHYRANVSEVPDAGVPGRVSRPQLQQHVYE